jgi:saccharopine dehydrogenase-like NADP-dependent oxidoreductase
MLSETPVEYEGSKISPRKFFLHIVNPLLAPKSGHNDTCIMYNTVTGKKNGKDCKYEYFMWENGKDGFSGMQRVTSFPAAIGTKMVAAGKIKLTGIRAPEECITGDLYTSMLADLKKVDITIEENSVLCI